MNLDILKKPAVMVADKLAPVAMKLSKHSPELLLGSGIVAMAGGTVLACVTTHKKLPERTYDLQEQLAQCSDNLGTVEPKEKTAAYLQACGKVALDYLPSAMLVGGGIGMVIFSHNQLRSRLSAVSAAYATLDAAYMSYRARVIEEHGADEDRKFRLGIHDEEVVVGKKKTKNGKEKDIVEVKEAVHADGSGYSMYARYFDQFNSNMHVYDQEANYDFLRIQQNIANEKFKRKGYLFLNEVYDALGFPEVPEGQLVGWVKGMGDDFVDFGIYEARNADARNYLDYNGKETCFVLDFNVDGVMWDLI